jgi:hypothetical protein
MVDDFQLQALHHLVGLRHYALFMCYGFKTQPCPGWHRSVRYIRPYNSIPISLEVMAWAKKNENDKNQQ